MGMHTQKVDGYVPLTCFISEFDHLTATDVVGHYTAFEVYEVIGFGIENSPFNVYAIAIATDAFKLSNPMFLCDRISISGLKFGIRRSVVPLYSLRNALDMLGCESVWKPVDNSNGMGVLSSLQGRFVPANSMNKIALNRLIKNNFFNGSYVLELFDTTKKYVMPLLKDAKALASLSEEVGKSVPIDLASVSDRLGNVIFQFPIEVIRSAFGTNGTMHSVEIAWHPRSTPRKLVVVGSVHHDQTLAAFGCVELCEGTADLCVDADLGLFHGYVWDVDNKLLLAGTDDLSFIKQISLKGRLMMPEPRIFPVSTKSGSGQARIQLGGSSMTSGIGENGANGVTNPIQSRIYDEERQRLANQRTFVQYGVCGLKRSDDRKRALKDIRSLISQHGDNAVWLWDPYLSPQDILDTLFWNKNAGSQMRALTLLKVAALCNGDHQTNKGNIFCTYTRELNALDSNLLGLNVEYRSAHGPKGWDFHDRFLIFPASGTSRALAWSLGTSVNSLGKTHHILQQVDNAQLVANAFEELWNAVDRNENLIWKHP